MPFPYPAVWVLASGLASAGLITAMLASGRTGALDHPNERSLHSRPVPRSGGLGVLLAAGIGFVAGAAPLTLSAAVLLVALVSWLDDQKHQPIAVRFAVHFLAAGIVAFSSLSAWGYGMVALAVIATVWMTNLYNFMDGMNGLAGGMAMFGFGALAIAAYAAGADGTAITCGCISAGAIGFLLFNFHPARIFLGDVGSIPLGFLAAALGLEGVRRQIWPVWFPLLVFSPFVVDATITLLRRGFRGDKVWQAHREHYYQRLVRMGWSHRRTALAEYGLMAAMAALALALRTASALAQSAGIAAAAALYLGIAIAIDRAWRRAGATQEATR